MFCAIALASATLYLAVTALQVAPPDLPVLYGFSAGHYKETIILTKDLEAYAQRGKVLWSVPTCRLSLHCLQFLKFEQGLLMEVKTT